jgi:hypothetical protein
MSGIRYIMLGVVLLIAAPLAPVFAQPDDDTVRIEAVADPNPVGREEVLAFIIRVRGASLADIDTPEPPLTRNLALQRPTPATERNVSFSNGRLTRSVTFRWTYKPVGTGTARIYPTEVVIRGTPYETAAIDIDVVPQSQRGQRSPATPPPTAASPSQRPPNTPSSSSGVSDRDLFIRVQPSTQQVYQNEQLIVAYRLYFRNGIQLRHSRLASAWDATGFWREELNVDSRPIPRTTTLDGRSYQTIVLKRAALFPTQSGSLRVDPLEIETEARAAQRYDPSRPFYTPQGSFTTEPLASAPLYIDALPLPDGAPPSFKGAVGTFRIRATIDSSTVQVGQPVRLRIQIEGTGNIATLQPPVVEAPADVEMYDPKEQVSVDRDGARVRGTKTFTYVLVPQAGGIYRVPPITFSYFDPTPAEYRTVRATVASLQVEGDTPALAMGTTGRGLPVNDVASIMTSASTWTRVDARPLYRQLWPYMALLAPLLGWGGLLLARHRTAAGAASATPRADDHTELLDTARQHMRNQQPEACYDAVERAVLRFIGQQMNVAAGGLTRPQLDDMLAQHDVPTRAREALFELLDVCDQARYSPAYPSEQAMQSAIRRAEQLIDFFASKLS